MRGTDPRIPFSILKPIIMHLLITPKLGTTNGCGEMHGQRLCLPALTGLPAVGVVVTFSWPILGCQVYGF